MTMPTIVPEPCGGVIVRGSKHVSEIRCGMPGHLHPGCTGLGAALMGAGAWALEAEYHLGQNEAWQPTLAWNLTLAALLHAADRRGYERRAQRARVRSW